MERLIATLVLVLFGNLAAHAQIAEHTNFQPIPVGHFNRLLESIVAQEQFILPDVPDRPVVTGNLWKGFEHNLTSISADIDTVTMRFIDARAATGEVSRDRAPSFDLQVVFEDGSFIAERMAMFNPEQKVSALGAEASRVVLRHSRAAAKDEMNGIRLAISPDSQSRVYFNGLDRTGVAIFIPEIPRTDFAGRGMLVCPREFDIWKAKRGSRRLENSDYQLVSAVFQAQGKVAAKVNTGLGTGYAAASIQTSPNILPSELVFDESVARYPYAAVDYRPVNRPLAPATFISDNITAGITVSAVHHNSFQQRTVSRADVVIGLRNVDIKTLLTFKYADNAYAIQPGSCVALMKEIYLTQENSKLPLPEGAQLSPQAEPSASGARVGEHLFDQTDQPSETQHSPLEELLN